MNITSSLLPRKWETKCRQKKASVLTQFKNCLWTCNRMRQPETAASMAINFTTIAAIVTPLQDQPFWFYRKLKRWQAKKYPDSKENRLHDEFKSFRIQSSHFKFRIQNLRNHVWSNRGVFISDSSTCVNQSDTKTFRIPQESGTISSRVILVLEFNFRSPTLLRNVSWENTKVWPATLQDSTSPNVLNYVFVFVYIARIYIFKSADRPKKNSLQTGLGLRYIT